MELTNSANTPAMTQQLSVSRVQEQEKSAIVTRVEEEVARLFPDMSASLSTEVAERLDNYSEHFPVQAEAPLTIEASWSYRAFGGLDVELKTCSMPEDLLDCYHLNSGEFEFVTKDDDAPSVQWAQQVEQALGSLSFVEVNSHILQEPHFSRIMSKLLSALWSQRAVTAAIRQSQHKLRTADDSDGVKLSARFVEPIEVSVAMPNGDTVELRFRFLMQLEATQTMGGQQVAQSLPFYSLTEAITLFTAKPQPEEIDEAKCVNLAFAPFIPSSTIKEEQTLSVSAPTTTGYFSWMSQTVWNWLGYREHPLKQGKYHQSLSAVSGTALQTRESFPIPLVETDKDLVNPIVDLNTGLLKMRAILSSQMPVRTQYRQFLTSLRQTVSTSDYTTMMTMWKEDPNNYPARLKLVHEIAKARFLGNEMYDYCQQLVTSCMSPKPGEVLHELPWEEQFQRIDQMPPELGASRLAVTIAKLSGYLNIGFDPHRSTNVPYANYRFLFEEKERLGLRFGTPTRQVIGAPSLNAEFVAFLDALLASGKKHLYINLQDRNPRYIGDESRRSKTLEALAEIYPNTFYIVTFAQDSDFYNQAKEFEGLEEAGAFKTEFLAQMLDKPDSGFHFSTNLGVHAKMDPLINVLEEVHARVFDSRDTLSVRERQDFIEIAYTLLTLQLLKLSDADTFNMSCKDAIDRGGKSMALLLRVLGIISGKDQEPEFAEEQMVSTHSPALIVKKQPIIPGRAVRFTQATDTILSCIEGIRGLKDLYTISDLRLCRRTEGGASSSSSSSGISLDSSS